MLWKNYLNNHPITLIATGPSLASIPNLFLRKYPTMGVNNCYLRKSIYPWFYVRNGMNQLNTPKKREASFDVVKNSRASFIGRRYAQHFPFPQVYPLYSDYDNRVFNLKDWEPKELLFSMFPMEWVGVYATVTYVALQILLWMNPSEVYIVGLDHTYQGKDRHFYKDEECPMFIPEDRLGPGGSELAGVTSNGATEAYKLAREKFEEAGKKIYNLCTTSNTDAFEKREYTEFM